MIAPAELKALIFDLDDTLVVEEASAEAAFLTTCELARTRYSIAPEHLHRSVREVCRQFWYACPVRPYCVEVGISSWEALWARFHGADENLRFLRDWAPTYRRQSWHGALRKLGIDDVDFAAELAETFPRHRRKLHVVYEDTQPVLEHFRGRYRLGLLTNGAPDLQREKIAGAGIGGSFDEIVISGDLGFGKPDPRIYETMLSRLDARPQEAIMIGNSLHTDVQGAQAVGMKAIWVNRAGATRDDTIAPDLEVATLADLKGLLARPA